jgi:hypothetical protein
MTSHSPVRGARFTVQDARCFHKHGYCVIPQFLPTVDLQQLQAEIERYVAHHQATQVRWAASHFDTFNGALVDEHVPTLDGIYDHHLLGEIRKLDTRMATLAQRSVGLSINVIPNHGRFQPHFDRHRMTAVLYVNDDYEGGAMRLYPRIRYWLGPPTGAAKRKMQRLLDRYVRRESHVSAYSEQTTIKPRAGDLIVFEGTRTYHAVQPVTSGMNRISIQFAYDFAGMVFDISDYYGKT